MVRRQAAGDDGRDLRVGGADGGHANANPGPDGAQLLFGSMVLGGARLVMFEWMPHALHSLIESGILLTSLAAVLLNLFLNGAKQDDAAIIAAAKQAEAH